MVSVPKKGKHIVLRSAIVRLYRQQSQAVWLIFDFEGHRALGGKASWSKHMSSQFFIFLKNIDATLISGGTSVQCSFWESIPHIDKFSSNHSEKLIPSGFARLAFYPILRMSICCRSYFPVSPARVLQAWTDLTIVIQWFSLAPRGNELRWLSMDAAITYI